LGEIQSLARGDYTFGPQYGNSIDLRHAIASSYSFVQMCLSLFDAARGLGQAETINKATSLMHSALKTATPQRPTI
jgi:hypothetical protein